MRAATSVSPVTADVQRDPTVCLCGGRPGPHGYGEPGCLDAADVQRELAEALTGLTAHIGDETGLLARHSARYYAAELLPTVEALIADAEKRAAAAALREAGRGGHFTRDGQRWAADRAPALDSAGAASGETT